MTSALAAMAISTTVNADFIAQFRSSIQQFYTTVYTFPTNGTPGTYNISIPDANTGFWRIYSTDPANESLNTITFSGGGNRDIFLVLGRPDLTGTHSKTLEAEPY